MCASFPDVSRYIWLKIAWHYNAQYWFARIECDSEIRPYSRSFFVVASLYLRATQ